MAAANANWRPVCLACLTPTKELFKKSDGDFIKLLDCPSCGKTVDHYVECEKSIIFMDMLLQEIAVYRHILFNADNFAPQFYIKLAVPILLSEGYIRWTNIIHNLAPDAGIKNNEVYLYIMCILIVIEMGIFGAVIVLYSSIKFQHKIQLIPLCKGLLLAQYGRLANVAAIIWYQGSGPIFQAFVLVFIIISTIQSTRAAMDMGRYESSLLVITATLISLSSSYVLQPFLINMYESS